MMKDFDAALAVTLGFEGGMSDHPADRGGLTKWGVTQRAYDAWRTTTGQPLRPVTEMEEAEMRTIYLDDYWTAAGCDRLPSWLAGVVFDCAVNSSPRMAVKLLQRALGVDTDGVCGPDTVAAALMSKPEAALAFLKNRAAFYRDIVKADPSQIVFLGGWMSRLLDQAWRHA